MLCVHTFAHRAFAQACPLRAPRAETGGRCGAANCFAAPPLIHPFAPSTPPRSSPRQGSLAYGGAPRRAGAYCHSSAYWAHETRHKDALDQPARKLPHPERVRRGRNPGKPQAGRALLLCRLALPCSFRTRKPLSKRRAVRQTSARCQDRTARRALAAPHARAPHHSQRVSNQMSVAPRHRRRGLTPRRRC